MMTFPARKMVTPLQACDFCMAYAAVCCIIHTAIFLEGIHRRPDFMHLSTTQ